MSVFQQGPGPSGKNDEKSLVLTDKIEDLVAQVCNKFVNGAYILYLFFYYCEVHIRLRTWNISTQEPTAI